MYAYDLIGGWAQTINRSSKETKPNNQRGGKMLKWLDAGVIYPISDSSWVSPVQVVPKKGGTIVIRTESKALLPS